MTSVPSDFTITTKRLRLKAADISEVDFVWSATRFEGFNNGLAWDTPNNKSELVDAATRGQEQWQKGVSFTFTSELLETGEPVGRTGTSRVDSSSEWRFGFWVHPDFWGHGYASEAGEAVLEFIFSTLQASKVLTAHAIWNSRSQKVIEKLGFEYTGKTACGFMKNGEPVPEYEYVLSNLHSNKRMQSNAAEPRR